SQGTCILDNSQLTLQLPDVSASEVEAAGSTVFLKTTVVKFLVNNCPSSYAHVAVKASFTGETEVSQGGSYSSDYGHPKNVGTAKGIMLTVGTEATLGSRWKGQTGGEHSQTFDLTNGSVEIPVFVGIGKTNKSGVAVKGGNVESSMNFEFAYQ
ncbi:TPA: fimbrial protein, partial [Yersinia enterocolitica]